MIYSASDVAKWFIAHNNVILNEGDSDLISNLKLQKLLYYAQGVYLALHDEPLFSEKILAWKHGPVVREVYELFKNNGSSGIPYEPGYQKAYEMFDASTQSMLREVYDVFGQYSAWKLREMTHEETPWKDTFQSNEIHTTLMKDYFIENYVER